VVTAQNVPHRDLVETMSQVRQRPLDAAIAPGRILFGHAHDQLLNFLGDTGSAKLTTLLAPVKFLGDQSLIPAHEGIGRHEGCYLFEALGANWVRKRRETTAFRIRQVQPAATKLGFENAVFLKKIGDNLLLVLLEPSSDHGDQDLENHSRSSGWKS
jgi:hypothetical protein